MFATFIVSILALMLLAILLSLHAKSIRKSAYLPILIKSSLLSLPLAILLFLVMPRLPALWQVPIQNQATTGLSDTVSPGDIANLSRSSALAFRATFKGEVVGASDRYWRAMTLDLFDGKTWSQSSALKREEFRAKRRRSRNTQLLESNQVEISSDIIKTEYELIIEPHYNHWVPVLDYASPVDKLIRLTDFSLRSQQPIVTRKSLTVLQLNQGEQQPLSEAEIQQFTQLPSALTSQDNQQTDAWINLLLQQGMSKDNILKQLLKDFSTGFRYTLSPPLLTENQIDDFLFNSKAGFCVHYASSFLYVARRLGFPARMVTGYLGGEWQETEGFFIVRQYDAHAWVEIWRNGTWERIDPTAYVASERVESGLQAGLTDSNEFLAGQYFSLERWRNLCFTQSVTCKNCTG
ncbi:transglutaminaseTgpA domain-containing protein [Psychromonas sp. KJ10-10]|uniref:transglutaminase family protein n=1 Tax=Psychromonas sp. KJ10-10 TaxID=3391823 RepID=UPI0039B537B5